MVLFDGLPEGTPRIVGYEAKWVEQSICYTGTVSRCPAALDPDIAERARDMALRAATAVGLRDYARIDMRLREHDRALFVLEANPNPDLSPDAGFMRAAAASGRTVEATILEIFSRAVERVG